jgi:hypothetical protein
VINGSGRSTTFDYSSSVTRLQAPNGIEQSAHRLGRAAHCVGSLLERFTGRDAPPDLESFLSGQPQTLCPTDYCQELSDRRAYTTPRRNDH